MWDPSSWYIQIYSKTCVKWPLSKRPKMGFKTNYLLMQVKSIAECSKGSILNYFRPSLSYQLSLRSLFCLFLSGHITQVLLHFHQYLSLFPYIRIIAFIQLMALCESLHQIWQLFSPLKQLPSSISQLTLLGNFTCFLLSADFFFKTTFSKNSFKNITSVL